MGTCQTAPSDTCDSTWLSEEYSTQSWHCTATMASCKGCAPPTQAPTTPAPTHVPTPAPPPIMVRLGSGKCYDSRKEGIKQHLNAISRFDVSLEEMKRLCLKYEGCVAFDFNAAGPDA